MALSLVTTTSCASFNSTHVRGKARMGTRRVVMRWHFVAAACAGHSVFVSVVEGESTDDTVIWLVRLLVLQKDLVAMVVH